MGGAAADLGQVQFSWWVHAPLPGADLAAAGQGDAPARVLFAFAGMVIGGGQLVVLTFQLDQISAALGIRVSWIYLVLPLSGLLIAFYGLCQLRCLWQKIELTPAEDC